MNNTTQMYPRHKLLAIAYLLLFCTWVVNGAAAPKPRRTVVKHSGRVHPARSGAVVPTIHGSGQWELLLRNTGVVAMHMVLTHKNTVVMFDQSGSLGYRLHRRRCLNPRDAVTDSSCYAHSVEYDLERNQIRPLHIQGDTWCSSGSLLSNGTLMQTGGFGEGSRMIRYFKACDDKRCDWSEAKRHLSDDRWYASNLRLPESHDRVIVVGGRSVFSYEFVPKRSLKEGAFDLPFLHKTYERDEGGNNLYPFVHLSSDGNLFVFANRDSILLDYKQNHVVKNFPRIPGKGSRSYPSTGSSVILPLTYANSFRKVEVMICGGAAAGAFSAAKEGIFMRGMSSCGRMFITGNTHKWKMETMPAARLMNDMVILPNGNILIINGVKHGCAGWNTAANPSYHPYLYKPKKVLGKRFTILKATKIARMYHSSAILLPDGRVLVGGSNPNNRYVFKNVEHPTELRLQAFVPPHMDKGYDNLRPHNISIYTDRSDESVGYEEEFSVKFRISKKAKVTASTLLFSVYAPPFNTHSVSMSQRLLILKCKHLMRTEDGWINALLEAPPSAKVAPAGYYLLTVVNNGIPSKSQWINISRA